MSLLQELEYLELQTTLNRIEEDLGVDSRLKFQEHLDALINSDNKFDFYTKLYLCELLFSPTASEYK